MSYHSKQVAHTHQKQDHLGRVDKQDYSHCHSAIASKILQHTAKERISINLI